jgi:hypothetical protein
MNALITMCKFQQNPVTAIELDWDIACETGNYFDPWVAEFTRHLSCLE